MAKDKIFTFEDLNKQMSTISKYGNTMDKSDISNIDHYINSGNYLLNACLTGSIHGGYPNNRAVCLAGPSGTGKTYLILNAVREAQRMGYSIIFYDSENAVDIELISKFGIDPTKFRYEPCNTVQDFRTSITNLTDSLITQKDKGFELPKIMVILDSAGNLATQKELDDAKSGSDKSDMTRAKILKSIFRILMTQLGICKIPLLFTNHTYQTQDLFSKQVGSGGCVAPGTLVLKGDNSYAKIEDLIVGDKIQTLLGPKEVEHTWEFEKKSYKIEFEDGSNITCSEDHRFFIGSENDDIHDNSNWIYVKDIIKGDEVSIFEAEE